MNLSKLARRSTLLAAGILALGLGAGAAQAAPFRLIITDLETALIPNSVMDLAESLGYFDREGVDVELVRVQQTPSAVAALQAGEGEMANISLEAALALSARDQLDIRAVTSPNKYLPYIIAAKQDIADLKGLEGRAFGIGRIGSLDYELSSMVMRNAGVDLAKINFVPIGQPAARGQALAAGQIDATTMSIGIYMGIPDKTGLHLLVSAGDYAAAAPIVNKVNVVTAETLANRRAEVVAVIRALTKLSREFNSDPSKWVEAMVVARPDVARADLETLAEIFRGSWSVNGGMSRAELEPSVVQTYKDEELQGLPVIPLEKWVDFGPADEVLAEIGVDSSTDAPGR